MQRNVYRERVCAVLALVVMAALPVKAAATDSHEKTIKKHSVSESPVRGIERDHNETSTSPSHSIEYRSIDGGGNNLANADLNKAGTQLMRRMHSDYSDDISQMAGQHRAGPRDISNAIADQVPNTVNTLGFSDYLWQWGQFLDHDIDLTDGASPAEFANIGIPNGDPQFDPDGTGAQQLTFNRSFYDPNTGTGTASPRQQINEITGWIDASNVYGSNEVRAMALRTNDGTGRLKTSTGHLMPFNVDGLPNAGGSSDQLFLAGDVRANEQIGLTAMHTLFVREHNRLARSIRRRNAALGGDEIYERARRMVGAQMQIITYKEFIPLLLGKHALNPYQGYDSSVDPRIMNAFSTAAYRLGHSLLSPTIMRVNRRGKEIAAGHLPLRNAFFNPSEIVDSGIEPLLLGLSMQACLNLDPFVVDDVRNFLFGEPGNGGFDLAALNIQRGRDHGLPGYNDSRELMGLPRAISFADVTSDPMLQQRLASVYPSPDDIDLWVGGLAEDDLPGAIVGELYFYILKEQFEALRDGDRFWYQYALSRRELRMVRDVTLTRIIRRNTRIGKEMSGSAFHVK